MTVGARSASVFAAVGPRSAPALAAPQPAPQTPLCTITDPRIREASGVAVGGGPDAVFYTRNDSGADARYFVLDRRCQVLAVYRLGGVTAVDWEDIARGPDEASRPCLWLADIGDNRAARPSVALYRVPEPSGRAARPGTTVMDPVTAFPLTYDDGPRDAEALLVHPRTGAVAIVTKSLDGVSAVYQPIGALTPGRATTLRRTAGVSPLPTDTPGGPVGVLGSVLVTGGAVSPAGDRVVLRTYTDAYVWPLSGRDVASAFSATPTRLPLPVTTAGEGVTFTPDGRSVVTTTEGSPAPLFVVPLPAALGRLPAPRPG